METPSPTLPQACTGRGHTNALPRAKRMNKYTLQATNNLIRAADGKQKFIPLKE